MKVFNINDFSEVRTQDNKEEVYQAKMTSQGQNSAYIVHEMANLVAVLQGRYLVASKDCDSGKMEKLGGSIERLSDFLMVLKKLNSRNISIGQVSLAEEVTSFLKFYAKEFDCKGITVLEEIDDLLPEVNGEKSMIFMILQTVCTNSLNVFSTQSYPGVLTFSTKVSEGYIDLIIKDNAGGMTSEQAEKIVSGENFEGNSGTGQGIQMIKQWAEYMGIGCKLRNIPGVGVHWLFRFKENSKEEQVA